MNKKLSIILFSGILIISLIQFISAITGIYPTSVYPGDTIGLTISPNKKFGFYNIIYVHDSNDNVVDLINIPCDTVCTIRQNLDYIIPSNFLGDYYFATFDYEIDDYELDPFIVIEQGEAPSGTLTLEAIRNFGSNLNFFITPEQAQRANIEILTTIKEKSCETYDVFAYLCKPDNVILCSSENYDFEIPLNFVSKTGQTCSFNYIGTDYFPFYEIPGTWRIISKSGAISDESDFIFTELIAITYPSSVNFGTLNSLMWNTGTPSGGLNLSNAGNMPLTIDWQSDGFSCTFPPECTDFWPTHDGIENTFQIDDDNLFAEDPLAETGLNPTYIIDTPNNFFPETGLSICISDLCDDNIGEKTPTYYNLKLPDIERGVYQGDIVVTILGEVSIESASESSGDEVTKKK